MLLFRRKHQTGAEQRSQKGLPLPIPGKMKVKELRQCIAYAKAEYRPDSHGFALAQGQPTQFLKTFMRFEAKIGDEAASKTLSQDTSLALMALMNATRFTTKRLTTVERNIISVIKTGLKMDTHPIAEGIIDEISLMNDAEIQNLLTKLRVQVQTDITLTAVKDTTVLAIDALLELNQDIDGSIKQEYENYINKRARTSHVYEGTSAWYLLDVSAVPPQKTIVIHFDTLTKDRKHEFTWEDARAYLLNLPRHFMIAAIKAKLNKVEREAYSKISFNGLCLEGGLRGYYDYTDRLAIPETAPDLNAADDNLVKNINTQDFVPMIDAALMDAESLFHYLGMPCTFEAMLAFIQHYYENVVVKDNRDETLIAEDEKCPTGPLSKEAIIRYLSILNKYPSATVEALSADNLQSSLRFAGNLLNDNKHNPAQIIYFINALISAMDHNAESKKQPAKILLFMLVLANIEVLNEIDNPNNHIIDELLNVCLDKTALNNALQELRAARTNHQAKEMLAANKKIAHEKNILNEGKQLLREKMIKQPLDFKLTLLDQHLLPILHQLRKNEDTTVTLDSLTVRDKCIDAMMLFCGNEIPDVSRELIRLYRARMNQSALLSPVEYANTKTVLTALCPMVEKNNEWLTLFELKVDSTDEEPAMSKPPAQPRLYFPRK